MGVRLFEQQCGVADYGLRPWKSTIFSQILPPHLSPFVDNEKEGYMPERQKQIDSLKGVEEEVLEEEEEDMEEEEEEEFDVEKEQKKQKK